MKRTLIFVGLVSALFAALCYGQVIITPSGGGSGTLTSAQFNTNQFGVTAGGVVWGKASGPFTNLFLSAATDGGPAATFAQGGSALITWQQHASGDFEILDNVGGAINAMTWNHSASRINFVADVTAAGIITAQTSLVATPGEGAVGLIVTADGIGPQDAVHINNYAGTNILNLAAAGGGIYNAVFGDTNLALGTFKISADKTETYAPFTVLTNAPAFTAWTTNGRQMTVEADFLLTPAVAQPASVTLTVEMAGSFTNVWTRTAPANLGAETLGMTHRITPGARFKFTDSSGAGASAAFVARAYAEIYE